MTAGLPKDDIRLTGALLFKAAGAFFNLIFNQHFFQTPKP